MMPVGNDPRLGQMVFTDIARCGPKMSPLWGTFSHYETDAPKEMAKQRQEYRTTKKAGTFDVSGIIVIDYVLDDMDDESLHDSLRIYLEKEDYEYCQALCIEAERRGFKLKP